LLLKDAPCTNRSYHRCCPHISWNGSEQGRNVGAKTSADACPESIRPLRYFVRKYTSLHLFGRLSRRRTRQLPSQDAHQNHHLRLYAANLLLSSDLPKPFVRMSCCMWLAGRQRPDFRTINRFRSERMKDVLEIVFTSVLQFLAQEKYVKLERRT
jgi:hypothetical protein